MRPRIRTVKPEMRQDERYARLSYPARELFNGLITMADDEGRFRAPTSAVLGHVFPYDADAVRKLRDWITEIRESGMVLFYIVDGVPYGAFRHWKRHQRINRPRSSDLPPPPDHDIVSENAVNDQGSITESSRNDHPLTRGRAFRSDPLQVQSLCKRLADHIRRNDPKSDPDPESEKWQRDMRLLLSDRKGDAEEVERIIDWCQRDGFWHSNILSPGKLRIQFTQLVLKATPGGQVVSMPDERRERQERRLAAAERLASEGEPA